MPSSTVMLPAPTQNRHVSKNGKGTAARHQAAVRGKDVVTIVKKAFQQEEDQIQKLTYSTYLTKKRESSLTRSTPVARKAWLIIFPDLLQKTSRTSQLLRFCMISNVEI
jgi:hypothetical protein